jgi:hypothetical protein
MIKVKFTYHTDEVSIQNIKEMIQASDDNYDTRDDVWIFGDREIVLGNSGDGRYYELGSRQEYRCIMAQEYDSEGEPIEGAVLGFLAK